jgi:hypothetical protein
MSETGLSGTIADSTLSFYTILGRPLIIDAYAAEVLKAIGFKIIPKFVQGWPNIAVLFHVRELQ